MPRFLQQAASARIIEEPQMVREQNLKLPVSYYRELGNITTRLPTPKEACNQAIQALKVRLQMLPSVGEHLAKTLKIEPEQIVWKT